MQKIKKGDTVQIVAGRDKGKRGKVLEVFPADGKVRVEGVFVQKKHLKAGASQKVPNGGIIDRPGKIDVSNVKFYSEKLGRPVRVGFKTQDDGNKVRVARGRHGEGIELD
jgi:large subunit ribosomal protein L24